VKASVNHGTWHTVTSQTRDLPLCHGTKVSASGLFRQNDINPAVPSCWELLLPRERELPARLEHGAELICRRHFCYFKIELVGDLVNIYTTALYSYSDVTA